jgi:putative ABC transport system substrate-binding protein
MKKQLFDMPFGTLFLARHISSVMFLALCSVLLAPRFPADAQQAKVRKIGWLGTRPASGPDSGSEVLRRELHALGWVEGKNIAFEHRYSEGKLERLPALADELVRLKVDVIYTATTPGV